MAQTTLNEASRVQKWESNFFKTYVRDSGFKPYMSEGADSVILANYKLTPGGQIVNMPLVGELTSDGVTGSSVLVGNEEALGNYNMPIIVDWRRNAVTIKKPELHWTEMDLLAAVRDRLKMWCMSKLRTDIINAMSSIWVPAGDAGASVLYSAATDGNKDDWLTRNADRALFGNDLSNTTAGDHSASLGAVDATDDLMTADSVTFLKEAAITSAPLLRPMRHQDYGSQEFFVLFTGVRNFRALQKDAAIAEANREARPREVGENPIFQGGDLLWDGVIIRRIPEIPQIAGVGASSVDVEPAYLCGAQAVGVAWGQKPKSTKKAENDYQFEKGRGIEECLGVEKMVYNGLDHGMVTGFFAAPPRT